MRAVSFVLVVVACSSSAPSAPASSGAPFASLERSGARLQARGVESEGLFVFDGFFDTALGLMCDRGTASDGKERCLPRAAPCQTPSVPDPSTLVAFTSTSEVPLTSGISAIVANGDDGSRVATGELVDQGQRCTITAGACGAAATTTCPSPLGDGASAHGPLEEVTKTASDGTPVSRTAVRAPSLGGECRFGPAIDGSTRCLPASVATLEDNAFADAACTRPLFRLPACEAKFVRLDEPESCGSRARFYAALALGDQMFTRDGEACVAVAARPGLVAFGRELLPTNMPPGQPSTR